MKEKYEIFVNKDEFQQKILNYIGSDEMDKMIDNTVFKDKPECRNAIIHGMAIAAMLVSQCELFYARKE